MTRSPNGVTKTGMRAQNLSALLTHVHHRGVVSRADLVGGLGLSKTTVSVLIGELTELGWLESVGTEARSGAGRPGELIAPTARRAVLVVNPEIDGTTIALVAMGGRILRKQHLPRTGSHRVALRTLIEQVQRFLDDASGSAVSVETAVLVVPGAVDASTQTIVTAPSIGWRGESANAVLGQTLGIGFSTLNNGRASTIGEWAFGALRNRQDGICIFSGAGGVGGGLLVNGVVLAGAQGLAGEIGRMRIHDSDLGLPDNQSFEHLMRRDAIVSALGFTTLTDAQLREELLAAVQSRRIPTIENQRRVLANALATLRDLLDPEVIVLGGYFGALFEAQGDELLREINIGAIAERGPGFLVARSVELADMVLLGAAETHWKHVLADPLMQSKRARQRGSARSAPSEQARVLEESR